MRILSIYLGDDGTEWCRVVDGCVTGGVLPGDALWEVIERALDDGLRGSYEDPLSIAVGGVPDAPYGHKQDLQTWEVATPGVEVFFYSGWETAAAIRAIRRATGPVFEALRQKGLLDPEAPARRAAAVALDMAQRLA